MPLPGTIWGAIELVNERWSLVTSKKRTYFIDIRRSLPSEGGGIFLPWTSLMKTDFAKKRNLKEPSAESCKLPAAGRRDGVLIRIRGLMNIIKYVNYKVRNTFSASCII